VIRGRRDFGGATQDREQHGGPAVNLANAKVGQLSIPVADFERGVAFYRDTLGLHFLFAAPPQMAFFDCGGVRLLVGAMPQLQPPRHGSGIYFQVADIRAVHSELESKGVAFGAAPHLVHRTPQTELWLAEFVDPDGNQLALMSEVAVGDG
jgi:methylmalonyl-CoA/ethylmalonyl-CoA epimerase